MIDSLLILALTVGGIVILSIAIYFAIRFFAYKRSFPLPRQFDFLWMIMTLLLIFLAASYQPPLEGNVSPKLQTWTTFITFLLCYYLLIFVIDQFLVEYFLITLLKIYVSPPLRKAILLCFFAIAFLVGVQQIFSFNPLKFYTPTAILLPAIAFALKDSFGMFFAGVTLSRIIHIGDWIQYNDKEGEVTDINWARTVLRTWEGTYLFIPNSELQKGVFSSFSYEDKVQRCRLEIGTSYDAPPQKVKRVLIDCTQNADGILTDPAPEVLLLSYGDFSINYVLTFWVNKYSRHREISSEVSTRIWYAFKREGIEIPYPIRTVHLLRKGKEEVQDADPETLVSQIDIFRMLSQEEKHQLVNRLQRQIYLKGEIVVRQGEPGSSFYLVLKGVLEVLRNVKGKPIILGELKSGQFFGELSLLTGEPRSATVRASMDSEILRLEKADFQEILFRRPDLSENLAEVVSSRQALLTEHSTKESAVSDAVIPDHKKSAISKKIREFFNLKEKVQ